MSEEIWKNIDGYDGKYQVSNLGRVRSFKYKTPRILKPYLDEHGYYRVTLCRDNKPKHRFVHQLVEHLPNLTVSHGEKPGNRRET